MIFIGLFKREQKVGNSNHKAMQASNWPARFDGKPKPYFHVIAGW